MRNRRNPTASDATWQFDHAGQGEPGNVQSDELMVCAQVIGNDTTITWAGANGKLKLT